MQHKELQLHGGAGHISKALVAGDMAEMYTKIKTQDVKKERPQLIIFQNLMFQSILYNYSEAYGKDE